MEPENTEFTIPMTEKIRTTLEELLDTPLSLAALTENGYLDTPEKVRQAATSHEYLNSIPPEEREETAKIATTATTLLLSNPEAVTTIDQAFQTIAESAAVAIHTLQAVRPQVVEAHPEAGNPGWPKLVENFFQVWEGALRVETMRAAIRLGYVDRETVIQQMHKRVCDEVIENLGGLLEQFAQEPEAQEVGA